MKIIDAHTHVFPPEILKERDKICEKEEDFSILYSGSKAPIADFDKLREYVAREDISCAVLLSFPFKDKGLIRLCNDYVISVGKEKNFFPFIMVDRYDKEWSERELERCFSMGAKGVGEVSFYSENFGEREFERLNLVAGFLKEVKGVLFLHVNEPLGHTYRGKIKVDFQSLYNFVKKNPELKIILAHLGGGTCFFEFMPEIKEAFKNVFYDTAALPYIYSREVYSFIENYVSHKVIFGSDFPLLSYSRYKKDLLGLKIEKRDMILHKNFEKLIQLSSF